MLITDDFVLLNLPKTGSTFACTVIKTMFLSRIEPTLINRFLVYTKLKKTGFVELEMPHSSVRWHKNQHGSYYQIPSKHRNKTIASIIRNPYDRFESEYSFRWWIKHPLVKIETIKKQLAHYPEISLNEYTVYREMVANHLKAQYRIDKNLDIGVQTILFLRMFLRDPLNTFPKMTQSYFDSKRYLDDMPQVYFMQQENLKNDLRAFLSQYDFSKEELDIISKHEKVNVTKRSFSQSENYLTKEAIEHVTRSEEKFITILSDLGFDYFPPKNTMN